MLMVALLVPYVAMFLGLYVLRSAWIAFAIYHVLIVLLLWRAGYRPSFKGWQPQGWYALVLGLLGAVGVYVMLVLSNTDMTTQLSSLGLSAWSFALFAAYHGLVNPFFEEAYWRGLLAKYGFASDLFFAAYHGPVLILFVPWYWALSSVLVLTVVAHWWRRLAKNGLLVPLVSHLAADASIMAAVYLYLSMFR